MRMRQLIFLPAALVLAGCATVQAGPRAGGGPRECTASANTLSSPPGRAWMREQGWRFASEADAAAAYSALAAQASPWPDWVTPQDVVLPPGTRFQMAIGGGQTSAQPGAFGTFDNIDKVEEVRSNLAVKRAWKADVDRVVTYEVVRPLPAKVGPVGPQVDGEACRLLEGRWSQLQMQVPPAERMTYLKVVGERPVR